MIAGLSESGGETATPVVPLTAADADGWLGQQPARVREWLMASHFDWKPGSVHLIPSPDGAIETAVVGIEDTPSLWSLAGLPSTLPHGNYRLATVSQRLAANDAALGWALGSYRFSRYSQPKNELATLIWPACDRAEIEEIAQSIFLVRDLINTPAEDMGPEEFADSAVGLADQLGADHEVIVGDDLLERNYPAVHAVGRASTRAPRLIDIRWGDADAPRLTLVGKGVCFDSGGLNIKPAGGMSLMKKDMGGGAQVLGLARLIMVLGLGVRLRLLIPAVENSVSGNAIRPRDVIQTRKGLTVEIGNTDAEGRLILADALSEAVTENPILLIDCATLTGAARVALGPDVPAVFCPDDALADAAVAHGLTVSDPLWRLPLWAPYRESLASKVADINNISEGSFGGAITAALFLKEFVGDTTHWIHTDMMGWNAKPRPGRPVGGEAMGLRAFYALVRDRIAG